MANVTEITFLDLVRVIKMGSSGHVYMLNEGQAILGADDNGRVYLFTPDKGKTFQNTSSEVLSEELYNAVRKG